MVFSDSGAKMRTDEDTMNAKRCGEDKKARDQYENVVKIRVKKVW